jgi:hypothetical protein
MKPIAKPLFDYYSATGQALVGTPLDKHIADVIAAQLVIILLGYYGIRYAPEHRTAIGIITGLALIYFFFSSHYLANQKLKELPKPDKKEPCQPINTKDGKSE